MKPPHYCSKCPTHPKAHYWVLGNQGTPDAYTGTCKYCGRRREFTHKHPYDAFGKDEIHTNLVGTDGTRVKGEKVT